MIAPNDLGLGGTSCFGVDELYPLMERERSAHNGHATGVADVHGDPIGALEFRTFIPFNLKTNLRNDALVGAHLCPAIFDIFSDGSCNYSVDCHWTTSLRKRCTGEGQRLR